MSHTNKCSILGVALLAVAAVLVVMGGSVTLAKAAPRSAAKCNSAYKYCDPGRLRAGVYITRDFLHGTRVTVPGRGWSSQQDSTTEFKLSPPGYQHSGQPPVIRFWIDPRVTAPCTDKVLPPKLTTPARAVRWFNTNKNFVISRRSRTTIAGHIRALWINYEVSPRAPKCNSACDGACIDYFAFFGGPQPDSPDAAPGHTPGIKDGFGTGSTEPVRLYFAHIGSPSHSHLLVVGVDSPSGVDVARLRADAATMVADLHPPAKLPRTGKRCTCLNASDTGPR